MSESPPQRRWFNVTPDRLIVLLLFAECLFWLSNWLEWPAWHKGYAVLTCVAVVGVALVLVGLWFVVALVFRFRFQFNLRTLLLLVVVVALPFSWLAVELKKAKDQYEAVAAIEKSGGTVGCDIACDPIDDWAELNGIRPVKSPEPAVLQNLLGKDFLSTCDFVFLGKPETNDLGLQVLDGLPHLRWLHMPGTKITDAALQRLEHLSQLRVLDLNGTQITDGDLKHLQGLTQLQGLHLSKTKITSAGLQNLQNQHRLRLLEISDTCVSDAGLCHLEGLTQLQLLLPNRTQVTDEGVKKLQQALPNCQIVR